MDFVLSKIVGAIFDPTNFVVFFLFLTALAIRYGSGKQVSWGRRFFFPLSLFLFLCALFPVGEWALLPLENKVNSFWPEKAEGIILLTGDENPLVSESRGVAVAGHAAQRYVMAAKLARKYPSAKIVVVGRTEGFRPAQRVTTRAISEDVFKSLGIAPARLVYEEESRTTFENAFFATRMIQPKKGETWILVTSAYHLPRAMISFESWGWRPVPVASDYFTAKVSTLKPVFNFARQMRLLNLAAHEYGGLLFYRARGWTARVW